MLCHLNPRNCNHLCVVIKLDERKFFYIDLQYQMRQNSNRLKLFAVFSATSDFATAYVCIIMPRPHRVEGLNRSMMRV